MYPAIENPTTCEVRSVIRFWLARNNRPIEIYRQLCDVYGQEIMSESRVRQWCIDFKNGCTSVHEKDCSGRPCLVTDDLAMQSNDKIRENRLFTITELSEHFLQISRSLVHQIVVEKFG
ncbi:protein GVQW3-like [Halyomorpha halys]|uniref:protein GVQW3-like n=1 Tax=Halyomorpha halys TaxID=286706 RepID=UPI0034D2CC0D